MKTFFALYRSRPVQARMVQSTLENCDDTPAALHNDRYTIQPMVKQALTDAFYLIYCGMSMPAGLCRRYRPRLRWLALLAIVNSSLRCTEIAPQGQTLPSTCGN